MTARDDLRDLIDDVIGKRDNYYGEITDGVMNVVQPELDRLNTENAELRGQLGASGRIHLNRDEQET